MLLYTEESEAGCVMDVSEAVKRDVVRRVELKTTYLSYDSNAVGVPRKRSP